MSEPVMTVARVGRAGCADCNGSGEIAISTAGDGLYAAVWLNDVKVVAIRCTACSRISARRTHERC
jgi:hypothetical protein